MGSDNDYVQLLDNYNNDVINTRGYSLRTKYKLQKKDNNMSRVKELLEIKILTGDKSDNIKGNFPRCGPKTAIKMIHNPSFREKKINKDNYERNKTLIDFDRIPECIKSQIIQQCNMNKIIKQKLI